MAKRKSALDRLDGKMRAQQWKVVRKVNLSQLERTLDKWSEHGWTVFTIIGPTSDGFAVVLSRIVVL